MGSKHRLALLLAVAALVAYIEARSERYAPQPPARSQEKSSERLFEIRLPLDSKSIAIQRLAKEIREREVARRQEEERVRSAHELAQLLSEAPAPKVQVTARPLNSNTQKTESLRDKQAREANERLAREIEHPIMSAPRIDVKIGSSTITP